VFHNAKDKEERFSAYSCRVELLEKSKLIRTQVRTVQNSTCCVVRISLILSILQLLLVMLLSKYPSSSSSYSSSPSPSLPYSSRSSPSLLLHLYPALLHLSFLPSITPSLSSSHPSHPHSPHLSHSPGPRKPDSEHEGGP
jgi:hypothetical protein